MTFISRRGLLAAGSAAAFAAPAAPGLLRAQTATGTVRIVAPFPPGGSVDVLPASPSRCWSAASARPSSSRTQAGCGRQRRRQCRGQGAPDGLTWLFVIDTHAVNRRCCPPCPSIRRRTWTRSCSSAPRRWWSRPIRNSRFAASPTSSRPARSGRGRALWHDRQWQPRPSRHDPAGEARRHQFRPYPLSRRRARSSTMPLAATCPSPSARWPCWRPISRPAPCARWRRPARSAPRRSPACRPLPRVAFPDSRRRPGGASSAPPARRPRWSSDSMPPALTAAFRPWWKSS